MLEEEPQGLKPHSSGSLNAGLKACFTRGDTRFKEEQDRSAAKAQVCGKS